jgi:NADH-quinone oxidoreductase subunit G
MTDETVNIEIDGRPCTARPGQMIIEVTDAQDAYVPRFCYHRKLSIAANCRMCLVEVENVPKPLPACATPVTEGMKVRTRSPMAISAQKATMEFLLINHPLDCPICDQGGECELQDLAMGYGSDVSRYNEGKRVVRDKDLGPLVSTDMTRCIHCTRCVRFGQEIAGIQELGTVGRGEQTEIGTYIERNVGHELSGNIIDLCPVGALNSKPFRYRARSWEMSQHETIAPHDCVGSNLFAHVRRGRLMRVVPRPNDDVNETWISDRDRFSYEGIYAEDRLQSPMIREGDDWRVTDWGTALEAAAAGIRDAMKDLGPARLGFLTSPSATLEEHYLAGRIARGLGSENIDHRLMRRDFSDQDLDPLFPSLGMTLREIGRADAVLLVGCDVRSEAPMLAHRVRQAALSGGRVGTLGVGPSDLTFPVAAESVHPDGDFATGLAAVAASLTPKVELPEAIARLIREAPAGAQHRALAEMLRDGARGLILLGAQAQAHPAFGVIRALAALITQATRATLGYVSPGANSAGGALAGALPHRGVGGVTRKKPGIHAAAMFEQPLSAYLLHGFEPEWDCGAGEKALETLRQAQFVTMLTPYVTDEMVSYAHVLLPTGTFAETGGTFINGEGRWQSFGGVAQPFAEARPAWKVMRVLGNLLDVDGMDYSDVDQVRRELESQTGHLVPDNTFTLPTDLLHRTDGRGEAFDHQTLYACDPVVRRASALQATEQGRRGWRRTIQ